jgi:hypothetical protein
MLCILLIYCSLQGAEQPKKPDIRPIEGAIDVSIGPLRFIVNHEIMAKEKNGTNCIYYSSRVEVKRTKSGLIWKYDVLSYQDGSLGFFQSDNRLDGTWKEPLMRFTIMTDSKRNVNSLVLKEINNQMHIQMPIVLLGISKIFEEHLKGWEPIPKVFKQDDLFLDIYQFRVKGVTRFLGRDVIRADIDDPEYCGKCSGYRLIDISSGHILYNEVHNNMEGRSTKNTMGVIILPK